MLECLLQSFLRICSNYCSIYRQKRDAPCAPLFACLIYEQLPHRLGLGYLLAEVVCPALGVEGEVRELLLAAHLVKGRDRRPHDRGNAGHEEVQGTQDERLYGVAVFVYEQAGGGLFSRGDASVVRVCRDENKQPQGHARTELPLRHDGAVI